MEELGWDGEIPVDIELLVEKYGIDIYPAIDLTIIGLDSCISWDLKTMFISTPIYDNELRCKFSVAHELGHIFLHKYVIQAKRFRSIKEWEEYYNNLDEKDIDRMEIQANIFASYTLIPTKYLKKELVKYLRRNKRLLRELKNSPEILDREIKLYQICSTISIYLAKEFQVSHSAMRNRLIHAKDLILEVINEL